MSLYRALSENNSSGSPLLLAFVMQLISRLKHLKIGSSCTALVRLDIIMVCHDTSIAIIVKEFRYAFTDSSSVFSFSDRLPMMEVIRAIGWRRSSLAALISSR